MSNEHLERVTEWGTLNPENGVVIPWDTYAKAHRASQMIPGHTLMQRTHIVSDWREAQT